MDSRMNSGEGFATPQDKKFPFMASWVPVNPEKHVSTSGPIPAVHSSQLGGAVWPQLGGYPMGQFQNLLNYNMVLPIYNPNGLGGPSGVHCSSSSCVAERSRMINNIAGSYTQALHNLGAGCCCHPWANHAAACASATRNAMANGPLTPNLHSQANNWRPSNYGNQVLGNQTHVGNNTMAFPYPTHHTDGYPVNSKPIYNLNLPPRTEASAVCNLTTSFACTPETPDLSQKLENKQLSSLPTPTNESSSYKKKKQKNLMISTGSEVVQQNCDKFLQNNVDPSSAFISTPTKEKSGSDKGNGHGIDLNKTPQQKPPKRRKYRPKAVVEGKPKRTPRMETPTQTSSRENPSRKTRYVHKKGLKESAIEQDSTRESDPFAGNTGKRNYICGKGLTESLTEQVDSMKECDPGVGINGKRKYTQKNGLKESVTGQGSMKETDTCAGAATQPCRRMLDFDLEKIGNGRQVEVGKKPELQEGYNISDSQGTAFWNGKVSGSGTKSTVQISQQNGIAEDNEQSRTINNQTTSLNKLIPVNHVIMPGMFGATASEENPQMRNLNPIATNINMGFADSCQKGSRNKNSSIQQNIPQPVPTNLSNSDKGRESKGEYCHAMEQSKPSTLGPVDSLFCQEIIQMDDCHRNGSTLGADCPEAHKRKKTDNESHSMASCEKLVNDGSRQAQTRSTYNANAEKFTLLRNSETLDPHLESKTMARRKDGDADAGQPTNDRHVHSAAARQTSAKQHIPSELHSGIERMAGTNQSIQVHNLATAENYNHPPPTTPAKDSTPQKWLVVDTNNVFQIKEGNILQKQDTNPTLSHLASSATGRLLQEKEAMHDYPLSSTKSTGSARQVTLVDDMINKIKGLDMNRGRSEIGQVQNALVPYKGDGTMVLYEGFDLIKKRRPRPKVDLDPETDRVWKLLMEKEGGDDVEGTDKEKEKWWEEERRVFSGRAESFIARMHLIQGDRRFSKWKGSVVDSVIGVFLTQNVSDHLSSSAFMSLAARFPLNSKCKRTSDRDVANILVAELQICEPNLNPNGTVNWQESPSIHSFNSQLSEMTNQSTDYQKESENSGLERASLTDTHNQSLDEEVLSSQGSYDCSILQINGGIRSYSGSNSESEDPATGYKLNNGHVSNLHQIGNAASFEEFYNSISMTSLFHEGLKPAQKQTENGQLNSRLDKMNKLKGSSIFNQADHFKNQQIQVPDVPLNNYQQHMTSESEAVNLDECRSSWVSYASTLNKPKQLVEDEGKAMIQQNRLPRHQDTGLMGRLLRQHAKYQREDSEPASHDALPGCQETSWMGRLLRQHTMYQREISEPASHTRTRSSQPCSNNQGIWNKSFQMEGVSVQGPLNDDAPAKSQNKTVQYTAHTQLTERTSNFVHNAMNEKKGMENKLAHSHSEEPTNSTTMRYDDVKNNISKVKRRKTEDEKNAFDWDSLRRQVQANSDRKERTTDTMDSLDYEAMRQGDVNEISNAIKERGMNNMLAERIKEFLNRLVREHGSIDLEWLRDVPPDKAKDYLLSIRGLGLKSVECVRLLTLHHVAFPVDTNVGRIAVRLGWVPLQPLPESLQLHLLELYPVLESIQKYLWPRLCKLDQRTLYELHYQMITFGKVFCTKSKPNCNACPLRGECRHFASAFASARLALPGPEEKSIISPGAPIMAEPNHPGVFNPMPLPPAENDSLRASSSNVNFEPIIEEPATPEPVHAEVSLSDIEDAFYEDPDEIPTIKLNVEEFASNLQQYMEENMELQEGEISKALVALSPEAASIPTPKLKNVSRLRTEHHVYELPDSHPLLKGMDKREPDDPSPYLLAIWTPGETANSTEPPEQRCESQELGKLCNEKTCFSCNSIREANAQLVRGTILIPCRTATRGSFPLNGTYFQVNEVFADHESSLNPVDVPRELIWNLPRRIVYFGTSVSTIFKGLSTEGIQYCFWKGFVCVRGFDQKIRAPRPLLARLHLPASQLAKTKTENRR
ncbi:hypothetical protein SLEP1_g42654 [Rubroshorea leprosula]|uniref:HhH-GPD domain-containing protein n=1 Tax=Rubroshorea leprosula TaxID=152421 RepID=A0AAV5LAK8_9ROSI|nr:hypothetical protein SLEP1_g42654 [Rubroshorea leprosula]